MTSEARTHPLFQRGAEHYLDALAAIAAFEKEVQKTCAEVYERYSEELAKHMGLDAAACVEDGNNDAAERWATAGVRRTAQKDCNFWLYLWWDEDDGGKIRVRATISLYVYYKATQNDLLERFRRENPRCRVEKGETYELRLTKPMKFEELGSAGDVLDGLVLEWLGYCKSIGGLGLKKFKIP